MGIEFFVFAAGMMLFKAEVIDKQAELQAQLAAAQEQAVVVEETTE